LGITHVAAIFSTNVYFIMNSSLLVLPVCLLNHLNVEVKIQSFTWLRKETTC